MEIVWRPREEYVSFTEEMCGMISLALLNSGVSSECQQCHKGTTKIIPGATITIWQNHGPSVNAIVGPNTICAMTICENCGHKEEYDLSRLGLLEKFMPFFEQMIEKSTKEDDK